MDVAGTVGVAEVYEGGVYHLVLLALVQQVLQVTEVSVAAPHAVPGAVLVQEEHLARREPALHINQWEVSQWEVSQWDASQWEDSQWEASQ